MDAVLLPVRRRARLPETVVDQARKDGYTSTVFGRRRYLPELDQRQPQRPRDGRAGRAQRSDPGQRRGHHQGRDDRSRQGAREARLTSRMLLQVHDELVLEVAEGEREQVEALVRDKMGSAYPLDVPMEVSSVTAAVGTPRRTSRRDRLRRRTRPRVFGIRPSCGASARLPAPSPPSTPPRSAARTPVGRRSPGRSDRARRRARPPARRSP